MRKGIDEPIERIIDPPVDIAERLTIARQEVDTAQEELAKFGKSVSLDNIPGILAKERHRHAQAVLASWEKRVFEEQVFEIKVDSYVFHIIGVLAPSGVQRNENSKPSPV